MSRNSILMPLRTIFGPVFSDLLPLIQFFSGHNIPRASRPWKLNRPLHWVPCGHTGWHQLLLDVQDTCRLSVLDQAPAPQELTLV